MSPAPSRPSAAGRVHAGIAVGVLLVAAVGWNVLLYGKYLAKKPVPPPAGVEVQDHRLRNFPKSFGDFECVREHEQREEELDVLGTLKHEWNWYYFALLQDRGLPPSKGSRHVQLQITYYTGLLEAVPHVPERCIAAAGGRILNVQPIDVALPDLPEPWARSWKNIKIVRTLYETTDKNTGQIVRGVEYHFFSMNGRPEHAWTTVRFKTGGLAVQYCYFAKVQFAPSGVGLDNPEACDAYCEQFLRQAMPSILKVLPTAGYVESLSRPEPAPAGPGTR